MVQTRKERKAAQIPLALPDRSAPSNKTLLELAQERQLFEQADVRQRKLDGKPPARAPQHGADDEDADEEDEDEEEEGSAELSSSAERMLDVLLWAISLSMLHFTLDVLVQHQYAVRISWVQIISRTATAIFGKTPPPMYHVCDHQTETSLLSVFLFLMFVLHPHPSAPKLIHGLPDHYQSPLRQAIFFVTSVSCGCYLVYISNTYSYLAVMKQAPPLGCLWVWSVIEMKLLPATLSLACAGGYLWYGGYSIK
ncbi:hypothetical protein KJ359_011154 [Pestalotiopsis sp. 9143b]|nr:hypothetical protein KJ359_011154 [Pestalotiopsis sp. 9143b]